MAARAGDIIELAGLTLVEPRETVRSIQPVVYQDDHGGRYGAQSAIGWKSLALIAALHVVALAALCFLDVVHIGKKPLHRLTVMDIKPIEVTPPPAAAPKPQPKETPPVVRQIMAPPPIIQLTTPPPAMVAAPVTPPAPPAPSAPAAVVSEVAAPISAPDGSAKSLGNPAPKYPVSARVQHQQGVVRLRVVITPEGRVKDIAVAQSSGFDSLDEAALKTVRGWKFLPGKQAGVAVEAVGFLNIPFRLT